jgi:V/A-type H+/Na+-transporting ATPase subunit I
MPWLEAARPVRMARVAIVAPAESLRDVLAQVADAGVAEIDDLLADQAGPQARAAAAVRRSGAAGLLAWMPAGRVPELAARLSGLGGTLVRLAHPRGVQAPTLPGGPPARRALMPLVQTYGTVPYADIDPSWLAWFSYVLMFGMMFGDTGQGLLLVGAGVALRAGWPPWARRYRAGWPFVAGAGVAATLGGLLYGEFFGPTGVLPTLWLNPLDQPISLLLAAVAVGAVLLAGAYGLGTVNRWREGGWPAALYAPSGVAGTAVFLGFGVAAGGWYYRHDLLLAVGATVAVAGLALAFTGLLAEAGGSGTGLVQASVELFDLVIRLGSNVVSFARLAAFGLTHAALGMLVWDGSRTLWHRGGAMAAAAVAVFVVGNVLTFALEALVASIQALRLEYYELFSRVFQMQGRPFRPWHVPIGGDARGPVAAAGAGAGAREEKPCMHG